jgi:hypothetical protein
VSVRGGVRPPLRQGERGAVAVTAAIMLPVLLAFFAVAFNMGLLMDSRSELQNGSDSAALAGARSLDGTAAGLLGARRAAYAYSMRHVAFDQAITIDAFDRDLTFGRWHLRADECIFGSGGDCFEPLAVSEPRKITAVRILNGRDGGTHNGPLNLLFGAFLRRATATVRSAAVAVGGGAAAPACALPFAVAECSLVDGAGAMKCGTGPQRMVFTNAGVDAVGFANLYYPDDNQAPSGTFVADTIRNRLCNPTNFRIGPAKLQNGNDFDKALEALRGVDDKGNPVGTCLIGQTMAMPVTEAGCPTNPIFQGVTDVVGFVEATLTAVTDNKGDGLVCPGNPAPTIAGKPKNALILDISCAAPSPPGEWGGGRAYNVASVRTRLVQ